VTDNRSELGGISYGGGVANLGTMTMSGCSVTGNSATYGGGVYNTGAMTMSGSAVTCNSATYGGGVCNTGALTVIDSTVTQNTGYYTKYENFFNVGKLNKNQH
jgi:hypothetical protein